MKISLLHQVLIPKKNMYSGTRQNIASTSKICCKSNLKVLNY